MKKLATLVKAARCRHFSVFLSYDFARNVVSLDPGVHQREFRTLPASEFVRKMLHFEFSGYHRPLLGLPDIDFIRKTVPLKKCGSQCRMFSSFDFDDRKEIVDDDDNIDDGGEESANDESIADLEEVSRVAKVIDELFALDRNMEAVLDESHIKLTHNLVVQVLLRFKRARKPAFRFFCWAAQTPGFQHNSWTYNTMLMIMGKTRQFETLRSLLEEMGEKRVLDMTSFKIAVNSYAAGKERKKAVGVLELMKKYGFEVDAETLNCLLDALAKEKLVKEAQVLFDRLKGKFTPNEKTYTILLGGWCKVKNPIEAGRIWNEMIDNGLKPGVVTHNVMIDGLLKVQKRSNVTIDGLLKVQKRSDAIKLFEIMKAKGPTPDVKSYTILIRYLCKHSMMKEAVTFFDEMIAAGCEPDAAVYTCMVIGFGNLKKMNVVDGLLKEMKGKGLPPDGRLYNALIKLMTSRRMPDEAVRIYEKMIKNEIEPTIHTYNMIIKAYFLAGNSEMACAFWDEMFRRGCCPDENSYTVLIGGLIRQGRSEEACKYVEEILDKGMRVPDLDFSRFVNNFSWAGRPNILGELARKLRLSGKSEVSEIFARWSEMSQKGYRTRCSSISDSSS